MDMDHVRELKEVWAVWAAAPTRAPTGRPGARPSAAPQPLPPPEPTAVALGAVRTRTGYGLAVRYQQDGPAVARLVDRMRDEVGEAELDVRRVGPVRALGVAPRWAPDPSRAALTVERLRSRLRPLVAGASVAHERVTAGTVGALVTVDQRWFVLSNSHVLARSGLASPGDVVLQPGPADGGTAADRVGVLDRAVPFDATGANAVDAALARLDEGVAVDVTGAAVTTALLDGDEAVEKTGRTTGATTGRVSAIEVDDVVVDFGPGVGLLRFDGQVEVQGSGGAAFSAGGDSGSLVRLAGGGAGVGLLFAGSEQGGPDGTGLTYCNVLDDVLAALGVRLPAVGGGGVAPSLAAGRSEAAP